MNSNAKKFIVIGAVLAMLGVAVGAFGAHALKAVLSAEMLAVYQTGVQYHLIHSLGLIVTGLMAQQLPSSKPIAWAGWLMVAGVLLFSGSLYVLALTGVTLLGVITPLGGVAFIAAWVLLAVGVAKSI
jgi:uncharacterized membrane protein YgdD (TMEM256/DUF423 family)